MRRRTAYEVEHEQFRGTVRRFVEREVLPNDRAWRAAGRSPREVWLKAGEQGLLCPQVPLEYGGVGGDYRYNGIVVEELRTSTIGGFLVQSDIVTPYLLKYGSEAQKRQWLPLMVRGERIAAIAMTEPDAGSDLQGIRTRARRDGDEWVLSGQKTYISNGQNADFVLVLAKTDPAARAKGMSLFIVEADRSGFRRGRKLEKLGQPGADTSELFFDEVRLPAENLLGHEGQGFFQIVSELPQERLCLALSAVAGAQRAFDITLEYVKARRAFGKALIEFQNTRFVLADMRTELEVAWAFIDDVIGRHVRGELTAADAAMAKLWTTELQVRLTDRCLQLHGGFGYMMESEIAQLYADCRIQTIHGGASEIMKEVIGRTL